MLVQVRVHSLGVDPKTDVPVVTLKELDGERRLPIWIGPTEASAIAVRLAEMTFERPLTHDLLVSVIGVFGGELEKVIISRVTSMYFAELILRREDEQLTLDARPSDSIAVALSMNAEIFVHDDLLEVPSQEPEEGLAAEAEANVQESAPRESAE